MRALLYSCCLTICAVALFAALPDPARATYPPEPGMLERMEREGTLDAAKEFAKQLGNHIQKAPKRGSLLLDNYSSREIADMIAANLGRSLDGERTASEIGRSTSQELDWLQLDLNHDRIVDERDLLGLGLPRPKTTAGLPSLGTNYMPVLLIDFSDYPHYFEASHFYDVMFGPEGDGQTWFRGLRYFYERSSHGQLILDGDILGWYRAKHPRTYYHPDDNNGYPESGARQAELLNEAVTAFDQSGTDFSKFDNDGDGYVDQLTVIWSGPNGDWATFWWGYQTWWGDSPVIDGVRFGSYSWQWERGYYFGTEPPLPEYWDAGVVVHETGHALGIPDFYDYDGNVGPQGGVGGMDIMGGWSGEHGCYSKYVLGWLNPLVASGNLDDELLEKAHLTPDAVLFMPGYDPVSPWSEYFMAQHRVREELDTTLPNDGIVIWHVDATVREGGWTRYDNSYTDHKLLRLMEADGLEEIEQGIAGANAGDFYLPGFTFGPETVPNTNAYDGTPTGMVVNDMLAVEGAMTADFTLYASNPPAISITTPDGSAPLDNIVPVQITTSDDIAVVKVQLLAAGVLLAQWETGAPEYSYTWYTLPEFNGPLALEARAYDSHGQLGSDLLTVNIENNGLPAVNDDFETGLGKWRLINISETMAGHFTRWSTRISPGDPLPGGSGAEAFIEPYGAGDQWHAANDRLRSPRIDTSAYAKQMHLQFGYRCRDGMSLYMTSDNGANWTLIEKLVPTWEWGKFNRGLPLQGGHVYFELRYNGSLHPTEGNAWGAHFEDFSAVQAPSDAPQVSFTSHVDGETVSGLEQFATDALDDTGIAQVDYYLNNGLVFSDVEAPYVYERATANDDDHPRIRLKAIAQDIDGIRSAPAELLLTWDNPRPYPMFDDLESGTMDNFYFQNDGLNPNWTFTNISGSLGQHSMYWFGAGQYDQHNSDGLWYIGPPVLEGRQCVDLAHPDAVSPVLSFKYKGNAAPGVWGVIYLYSDWDGWRHVGDWLSDNNRNTNGEWIDVEVSLERFIGHSGHISFWTWTGEPTDGQGYWIDNVEVSNKYTRGPQILAVEDLRQAGEPMTIHGRFFLDQGGKVHLGLDELEVLSWDVGDITVMLEGEPGIHPLAVETKFGTLSELVQYTIAEPLSVVVSGLDSGAVYTPADTPVALVETAADAESIELYIDDGSIAIDAEQPFDGVGLGIAALHNGDHTVHARAQRRTISAESEPVMIRVYTLRGDVNGDGFVDGLDAAELALHIGLGAEDADYRPWYDCDEDGTVTEADQAYIGYFGAF